MRVSRVTNERTKPAATLRSAVANKQTGLHFYRSGCGRGRAGRYRPDFFRPRPRPPRPRGCRAPAFACAQLKLIRLSVVSRPRPWHGRESLCLALCLPWVLPLVAYCFSPCPPRPRRLLRGRPPFGRYAPCPGVVVCPPSVGRGSGSGAAGGAWLRAAAPPTRIPHAHRAAKSLRPPGRPLPYAKTWSCYWAAALGRLLAIATAFPMLLFCFSLLFWVFGGLRPPPSGQPSLQF